MNLLLDALSVLRSDSAAALVFLTCLFWGSLVVAAVLSRVPRIRSDGTVMLSLALGGWIVPVLLCSAVFLLLGILLHLHPSMLTVAAFGLVAAGWAIWTIGSVHEAKSAPWVPSSLFLGVLFLVIATLRLAFVARTPLPLYFDSAEHYRIIRDLMADYAASVAFMPVLWPVESYYHLGYHSVMAVLAALSQVNLARLMLVSGAIALAALPIPLFVIPYHETGSRSAGLLAVLLGSLGWYMPGYVLDWGKYPALFVVPVVVFTLSAAYLAGVAAENTPGKRGLQILALIGTGVALAIQTRSIILLAMMLAAWLLSNLWVVRPATQRLLAAALTFAGLIGVLIVLGRSPVLSPVLDPYLGNGIWITGLVGLLGVFAFKTYPRLAFASVCALVLLCLGLFIPVPRFASGPLLDRPLVEMVLFAPLSILGAAGFAAIIMQLHPRSDSVPVAVVALLSILIIANSVIRHSFYPSDCCVLVNGDDLAALDWLSSAPGADSRVLIPMAELSDAPLPYPPLIASSDAGAWVRPLTGRQTSSLPYWTDFGDPDTLGTLCQTAVSEIFVSSGAESFRDESLRGKPEWYIIELALPRTSIYRVTGCPQ
jgi:hypothetical protein